MRIETERLVLRPFVDDDASEVLDIHSRLDVIRWLGTQPPIPMATHEEALAWIDGWRTMEGGPYDVGLAIEIRGTGVSVGAVMIIPLPHAEHDERQIGWQVHPDAAGRGYATEAARAMLDQVFASGLDEVWCDMFADNVPSAKVAERLGLTPLGMVPDPWYEGESRLFHMTSEEWLSR